MTARAALLAAAALALAACGDAKPPPRPPPAAAGAAAAPAAAPAPAAEAPKKAQAPEWSYSSVGKRDPFRSFLTELDKGAASLATRCATPLGKFELEQLKLVAVVTGLEDPVAMVEAPSGVGYSVRRGACVGKNGGVVAAVRSGEVVVSEWALRADGTRDRTQTVLRLPKEAALNLEE
jgi:type IV pilus assembly protein PilP